MKYQKIFPKDWVDMHPYTTIDSVDQYYTKVANRVAEQQQPSSNLHRRKQS